MHVADLKNKTILYAVLDWGFGHVTRSIGIIRELLQQHNSLIIACNDEQKMLFRAYFPDLEYVFLEGYNFCFSGQGNWSLDLWKQRKSFFKSIKSEQEFVENYVQKQRIDCVISDHRYGFYSTKTPSVFITHQLHLPLSKLYFFIQNWHEKQLRKFSSLWILDSENAPLAGKLSRRIKHPDLNYIGWKTRFEQVENQSLIYDYLLVVSGPKPYSEQFLDEVIEQIDFKGKKVAVLHPVNLNISSHPGFDFFPANHLKEHDQLFYQSATIVSRSGYSTLMDLKILGKESRLIPTPGQKEQLYLKKINS